MNWIIENLFQIISLVITPILVWFLTKKHFQKRDLKDRDVSTESNQAEVISQNLGLYQIMIDDIRKRYNEEIQDAYNKIDALENIIKDLREVNKLLDERLHTLSNQLITIKGELQRHEKNSNNK